MKGTISKDARLIMNDPDGKKQLLDYLASDKQETKRIVKNQQYTISATRTTHPVKSITEP